jgi:DNA-directed RNA polymerase specialized sigma24 family protein
LTKKAVGVLCVFFRAPLQQRRSLLLLLLNHYWNEVYGFHAERTENETNAEDITIETFSKALTK